MEAVYLTPRHCAPRESGGKQSIYSVGEIDCFAALAMTGRAKAILP